MPFRGVRSDWRGVLVVSPTCDEWIAEALRRLGRPADADTAIEIAARHERADDELDGPGMDADLVAALNAVESDRACNPFVDDAARPDGTGGPDISHEQ